MIGKKKILEINLDKGKVEKLDLVAVDRLVNIFINGVHFVTLTASPNNVRELALGHLFGHGIVDNLKDIDGISNKGKNVYLKLKREIHFESPGTTNIVPTACGASGDVIRLLDKLNLPKSNFSVKFRAITIFKALRSLFSLSNVFRKTGGTHAAALYTRGGVSKLYMEDVGRHNAVDKVIGGGLIHGLQFKNSFLASTGRLSADIAVKCARAGIPLIASKAAPLQSGILAAELSRLTLIGFIRGRRLNVYTNPMRVEF